MERQSPLEIISRIHREVAAGNITKFLFVCHMENKQSGMNGFATADSENLTIVDALALSGFLQLIISDKNLKALQRVGLPFG